MPGKWVKIYFENQKKYEEIYGPKTIVMMKNGKFFEMYEYDPELDHTEGPKGAKMGAATRLACEDLEYVVARQSKERPYSFANNVGMAGFPETSYENEVKPILLEKNWTIVRLDQEQISEKPKKFIHDVLGEIVTPGTAIDVRETVLTNFIVSIYIKVQHVSRKFENYLITCGVSSLDVNTGSNNIMDFYNDDDDPSSALQGIFAYLTSTSPREIIINIQNCEPEKHLGYKQYIQSTLDLDRCPNLLFRFDQIPKEYRKLSYQRQTFDKLYPKFVSGKRLKQPNILDDLSLVDVFYGRISFMVLIDHFYDRGDRILKKISKPSIQWNDENDHLQLTHNAAIQLNIFPDPLSSSSRGPESLFEIIDCTSTKMGQRQLRKILSRPIANPEDLERSYDLVDEMLSCWRYVEKFLERMPDIDRNQRLLLFGNIKPDSLAKLFIAYQNVIRLIEYVMEEGKLLDLLPSDEMIQELRRAIDRVVEIFDLEKLKGSKMKGKEMVYSEYPYLGEHALYSEFIRTGDELKEMMAYLSDFCKEGRGSNPKCDEDGKKKVVKGKDKGHQVDMRDGITVSKTKAKMIEEAKEGKKLNEELIGDLEFSYANDCCLIRSEVILGKREKYREIKSQLDENLYLIFKEITMELCDSYNFYSSISGFISKIDLIKSFAKSSVKYRYFRPEIDHDIDEPSFVQIDELRHPLVERIISSEYITTDVTLSGGILLYGANSSGKSTFAKAVALNVIMAQIGGFTAGKMRLRPYTKLITRLTGNDDIVKGQSSFMIEGIELRTIVRNGNQRTLVIGDEVCRGTESKAGTGITVAGIRLLVQMRSSFILSSHMHHLVTMPQIQEIDPSELKICHLQIHYDPETEMMVFDRKLCDGPGDSDYGIEILKYLGFPPEFITDAMEISRSVGGEGSKFLNMKKSRYNRGVVIDTCQLCGGIEELETHHIKEQKEADEDGFIGPMRKNAEFNLIVLCKECHRRLHRDGKRIEMQQTPAGPVISVEEEEE